MPLAASEIRETFLRFFESRGHRRVASASLLPEGDPTLLFTNAGMVPFKRVFLGEEKRPYTRAATSQKCMRVSGKHNDLENVGRTPRHHTFFEMLGNFSFGDYFKREAIEYAWELVTRDFGISADRLVATVFREDDEAHDLWREGIGLPAHRVIRLGESENFWQMGETGPCGPCSEIHVDFGKNPRCTNPGCDPSCGCGRWLEIWNLVFMQFNRDASGALTPLPKPSIDTGAGLERLAAVIQGVPSNYDSDLFRGILARAQEIAGVERGRDPEKDVSLHVVADHARAVTFLIGDGVQPANEGRGYVLRRILRRAARHGVLLGIERPFLFKVADAAIDTMCGAYPELAERRAYIVDRIEREEGRFLETLSKGLALLETELEAAGRRGEQRLSGETVFRLYDTFGFPLDLTEDILRGRAMTLDQSGFDAAMQTQRERARAAWKGSGDARVAEVYGRLAGDLRSVFQGYTNLRGSSWVRALLVGGASRASARQGEEVEVVVDETPFYPEGGGQVGDRGVIRVPGGLVQIEDSQRPAGELIVHRGRVVQGEIQVDARAELEVDAAARAATVRNHSGTHLLHAALRRVLGPQAMQKGSLVAPGRLRFDFTHDAPLATAQLDAIEDFANEWIEANLPANVREMSYPDAIAAGAIAIFEEKYGERVRVISFGEVSTELCGGTHARATGDIGLLKILSDSGIASGVRRIEAATGLGALALLREQERTLERVAAALRTSVAELPERAEKLMLERREAEREIEKLKSDRRKSSSTSDEKREKIGDTTLIVYRSSSDDQKELGLRSDSYRSENPVKTVAIVGTNGPVGHFYAASVSKDLADRVRAGDIVKELSSAVGGKGGGRPDFAQGGGGDPAKWDEGIERVRALIQKKLEAAG
jgi:alanyl-tRNA synthetase